MVYLSQGNVLERRSIWRVSAISDFFWGIVDFIILFFHTMVSPGLTKRGNSYSGSSNRPGGGPPKPPGRRFGRIRGDGDNGPYNPGPPMGGG
ncbi:selenoprotein K [Exaiptasia diaphana]|uniref:Selenoprotein K n=1 Tax=Exaiptasia diaphana TaxID=2652724 RepID=A0A913XFD4_EXADI|nr:selenoprotein K [Exaiptasia diaphana]KXJ12693.1 Selenoprotein K [Exaiptasia diaphana]